MALSLVDLGPVAQIGVIGGGVAALFASSLAWRHRRAGTAAKLRALTWLTLFLTFDLIVFGAYTRLSDSGLGCPDWPGCYGHASPLGASSHISAAESALPTGPVTQGKAWIEMVHRYLATAVGMLITAMLVWHGRLAWLARHRRASPRVTEGAPMGHVRWVALIFVWVCAQGAFGALTVTMKLYPAIVTLHLLGGVGLLALLAVLAVRQEHSGSAIPPTLRAGTRFLLALTVCQVALGGWVSTNYAVLACQDFPTCQGQWWPPMDAATGFQVLRDLGLTRDGRYLPFEALTAIHVTHRIGALVVFLALLALAWQFRRQGGPTWRQRAHVLLALAAWQLASGVSNVVLDWPLAAALAHTAGASVLVAWLAALGSRAQDDPAHAGGGMLTA
jgi:cytochrome c oxidase assembly protein subunit 15